MTTMMKKNFKEMSDVIVAATLKGEEIKKIDFQKAADDVTIIEAENLRIQEVLRNFGFETC